MVKTLTAHLKGQNPKYPPHGQNSKPTQKSKPKLPTLKVKILSTHLSVIKTLTAHLKGENPKCPPQWSKL